MESENVVGLGVPELGAAAEAALLEKEFLQITQMDVFELIYLFEFNEEQRKQYRRIARRRIRLPQCIL